MNSNVDLNKHHRNSKNTFWLAQVIRGNLIGDELISL